MTELEATDRETTADWIEVTLLARGTHLGHDALCAVAREEIGASEAQIGLAVNVLERRAQLLGDRYPFVPHQVAVQLKSDARRFPYSLLLLLSPGNPARQLIHKQPSSEMVIVFERLVVTAMKALLGTPSQAVRFGWPSEDGRPPEFYQAIEWLATKMGIPAGRAYRPPRRKDGGVDVVAWRPFPDGRSGFPVLLVQCTLQEAFVAKAGDVDVRNWSGWLTLDADPTTVLAVPGTMPNAQTWEEIAVRSLILDRLRLAGLLGASSPIEIVGGRALVDDLLDQLTTRLRGAER